MDEQKKATRRRGAALEEAILRAAMAELSDVGYQNLTMESVAARAKTNKAVLYRRWPNKTALIVAALHEFIPRPAQKIPDTGNLRNDLYTYLRSLVHPLQQIGAATTRGLMMEQFSGGFLASAPQIVLPGPEDLLTTAMKSILANAQARGELQMDKLSARIISLPVDLLRYELATRMEPISDKAVAEIIDDIFLPLVCLTHAHAQ